MCLLAHEVGASQWNTNATQRERARDIMTSLFGKGVTCMLIQYKLRSTREILVSYEEQKDHWMQ